MKETPMQELFKKFGHLLPNIEQEYLKKEKQKSKKLNRSNNLWKKLVKELYVLQDDNYTARVIYNYVERNYE